MNTHRAPVLILVALALAACQPASPSPSQTQDAQSAFNTAVAAAQTQAAPPPSPYPTPPLTLTPEPTLQPAAAGSIATLPPDQLDAVTASFKNYLEEAVTRFTPPDGSTLEAHITQVAFQYYDDGKAAVVDIAIQKSDATREGHASGAVARALIDIYRSPAGTPPTVQRDALPPQMRVFRVHVLNTAGARSLLMTGNWADLIAVAQGTISGEEFSQRVEIE